MKIVYCHNRFLENYYTDLLEGDFRPSARGGTTVAMEVVSSWLLDTLAQGDTIVRKVGIARCSEDDNYCKKTGRELALSRMKTTTLTAVNIVKHDGRTTVFLEDDKDNMFELKKSRDVNCAILVRMLED